MAAPATLQPVKLSWRFPRTFWFANGAELFERAAWYGVFVTLVRYLNRDVGFSDVQAGWIGATLGSILYFLPMFMGLLADHIGFRRALLAAFALLTVGYALLGTAGLPARVIPDWLWSSAAPAGAGQAGLWLSETPRKALVLFSLVFVVCGGAIVKPVISGTAAKCSDSDHRARAMSIFYAIINIGSFSGKGLAGVLNDHYGRVWIMLCAAGMALLAFILVGLFYRNVDMQGTGKTLEQVLAGLWKVVTNFRFLSLILIVAGFWTIQNQLYASMPTYVERMLGEGYKPEWLANINPLVVVILVVPITQLVRKLRPESAIGIALLIIPFAALAIALSPALAALAGNRIDVAGQTLHPMVVCLILGIALQGLAECFLSPKFYEFSSKQAPPGEVGLYMGYQSLTQFFSMAFGFVSSGYLLATFCPDPKTLPDAVRAQWEAALAGQGPMPAAYAHAHYLWFAFVGVGCAAFLALLLFKYVTWRLERIRATSASK